MSCLHRLSFVVLITLSLVAALGCPSKRSGRRILPGTDAGTDAATPIDAGGGGTDAGPAGDGGFPATCFDGMRNGDESQADCGGSCPKCPDGAICSRPDDCESGVCSGGFCLVPTCEDGVHNGEETAPDCGGPCPGCEGGEACAMDDDCRSMVCEEGSCASTSCMDGVKNSDETDVDCGGSICDGCEGGGVCLVDDDCASLICDAGSCTTATCDDLVQNQDESDVDCGGTICDPCTDGGSCAAATDCVSGVCTGMICQAPTCSDGAQNQDETDVDCGGDLCDPCPAGDMCVDADDCESGVCGDTTAGVCDAASCTDGVINGGETDVDCGGATSCPRCEDGRMCTDASDCVADVCPTDRMRCGEGPVCTTIEGFEAGSWPVSPWVTEASGGTVSTTAAHDGTYGITDVGWHYRTDTTVGNLDDKLHAWVKANSSGRAYLGFAATASGALSFVMGPNTSEILFQTNSSYGYTVEVRSSTTFTTGNWYLMEIEFLGSGMVQGTVYESDGVTVLNTLTHDYGSFTPGGVAIRSFGTTSVDTIEVCR